MYHGGLVRCPMGSQAVTEVVRGGRCCLFFKSLLRAGVLCPHGRHTARPRPSVRFVVLAGECVQNGVPASSAFWVLRATICTFFGVLYLILAPTNNVAPLQRGQLGVVGVPSEVCAVGCSSWFGV